MVQSISTGTFCEAKWVVDATAGQGTHTTIASALTSASSGDTIFIRPGTYTENLTLKAGVNLTAFSGDELTPEVTIVGTCTFTAAGSVSISNIRLQTNSANLLAVTGSSASIVYLNNCYLNCSNNTGINFTSSSSSSLIQIQSCNGNIGTTGITFFTASGSGTINIYSSFIQNTGSSVTNSTISSGSLYIKHSNIQFAITTSSTGVLVAEHNDHDLGSLNTTAITHGGNTASRLCYCLLQTGTATPLSVTSTMFVEQCIISSSNATAISGAGNISIAACEYPGNSTSPTIVPTQTYIPTSTYVEGTWTPTLSSTSLNITYTTRTGRYTRIGNTVFVFGFIQVNTVTNGGSGTLSITGLPYTSANVSNQYSTFAVAPCTFAMGGSISQVGFVNQPNTSTLILYAQTASSGVTTNAHTIVAGEVIGVSGYYSLV